MAMSLSEQLGAIAAKLRAKFTFNGTEMTHQEVFADNGLLPAMAKRADQLCSLCLGYGIGASFNTDEAAKLGVKVRFDDMTPQSLRLICLTDVVNELINAAPSKDVTPLDELMYD